MARRRDRAATVLETAPPVPGQPLAGRSQGGSTRPHFGVTPAAPQEFHPTQDDIEREIQHVLASTLSPELQAWADRYAAVGRRNLYLWKWCRRGVEVTTLPCVPATLRDDVCDTKVLGVMLDVLLDDVADRNGEDDLLEYLLELPFGPPAADLSRFTPAQQAYARFTAEVWSAILARVERYPRFEEFQGLLRFDYRQLFNSMRYSHLLNKNLDLLNLAEHDVYTPFNMHMIVNATIDLMGAPGFPRAELGRLREVVAHGQCMGRIGNLVTTWERELGERDFTSGVYARAVSCGDLTVHDLLHGDPERVRSAIREGGHESFFLARWQEHRRGLLAVGARLGAFDASELVTGLQRLICLHLGSRGYK